MKSAAGVCCKNHFNEIGVGAAYFLISADGEEEYGFHGIMLC